MDWSVPKRCSDCGLSKPRSEFWGDRSRSDGLERRCKPCSLHRQKKRTKARGAAVGDRLRQAQGGACPICGATDAELVRDHDHRTGLIRGMLCRPCNMGLGKFFDDPVRLRRAADYLERPPARETLSTVERVF